MTRILMLSKSVYAGDVRVRREARALAEAEFDVTVVGLGDSHIDGKVHVLGLGSPQSPVSKRLAKNPLIRAARWFLLPERRAVAIRNFQRRALRGARQSGFVPDIVHAHDYPALKPAAELADAHSARLVYDAHEFWRGIQRHGRPDPLRRVREAAEERRLAMRADAIITVSEGAARLLSDHLGVAAPIVVRNTFPPRAQISVTTTPRGAVYAGRIGHGRDLATVFDADVWSGEGEGPQLHLIGQMESDYTPPAFAVVHPPTDLAGVEKLLTEIGIALVPLSPGSMNHEVALPNKLFEAVSVGVPVLAADLPEMADLVRRLRLGELYQPGDPASLSSSLKSLIDKHEFFRAAVKSAQSELDWSHDRYRLLEIYERLSRSQPKRNQQL